MREIKVGLIGFGTVGAGVAKILQRNARLIEKRMGSRLQLKRVADIDLSRDRGLRFAPGVLTTDARSIVDDPGIDIILEMIGGETVGLGRLIIKYAELLQIDGSVMGMIVIGFIGLLMNEIFLKAEKRLFVWRTEIKV